MKTFIPLLCLMAVAAAGDYIRKWKDFLAQTGKEYNDIRDEMVHLRSFLNNAKMIEEHNQRYELGLEMYAMEINQFADLTEEELVKQSDCIDVFSETEKFLPRSSPKIDIFSPELNPEDLPESVDWREEGAVTRVKAQGYCRGCWAFSATGAIEGQLFKKEGKLIELSEQNLIDCSHDFGNNGCRGGWLDKSFQYVINNGGINTREAYPYESVEGECRYDSEDIGAVLTGFMYIEPGSEQALTEAVATIGPVAAVFRVTSSIQFYREGIFYDPNCKNSRRSHAVLIIGYGRENDQDYWLIKNSWGKYWGEDGYFKMARNKDNHCSIATYASYPVL